MNFERSNTLRLTLPTDSTTHICFIPTQKDKARAKIMIGKENCVCVEPSTSQVTITKNQTNYVIKADEDYWEMPPRANIDITFTHMMLELTNTPSTTTTSTTYNKYKQDVCVICLEQLSGNWGQRQLYCGHVFHKNCLQRWTRDTCPLCRV